MTHPSRLGSWLCALASCASLTACAAPAPPARPDGEWLICDHEGHPISQRPILTVASGEGGEVRATLHTSADPTNDADARELDARLTEIDGVWRTDSVRLRPAPDLRPPERLFVPHLVHHQAPVGPSRVRIRGLTWIQYATELEVDTGVDWSEAALRVTSPDGRVLSFPLRRRGA